MAITICGVAALLREMRVSTDMTREALLGREALRQWQRHFGERSGAGEPQLSYSVRGKTSTSAVPVICDSCAPGA